MCNIALHSGEREREKEVFHLAISRFPRRDRPLWSELKGFLFFAAKGGAVKGSSLIKRAFRGKRKDHVRAI